MSNKKFVDWEIQAVIDSLLNLAIEKEEKLALRRKELCLAVEPNLREKTVEWYAIQIINQLQTELKEVKDILTNKLEQMQSEHLRLVEAQHAPKDIPTKVKKEKKIKPADEIGEPSCL